MTRILLALVYSCSVAASAAAQEAIFVVRHAERADQSADARLSIEGERRATSLARTLEAAGITHVFTTDLRRTIDTAAPLAAARHLTPVQVTARDVDALAQRVLALADSDRALVVGHSNTIPALLQRFGVADPGAIADDEYDNIFVVVPRPDRSSLLLRIKY